MSLAAFHGVRKNSEIPLRKPLVFLVPDFMGKPEDLSAMGPLVSEVRRTFEAKGFEFEQMRPENGSLIGVGEVRDSEQFLKEALKQYGKAVSDNRNFTLDDVFLVGIAGGADLIAKNYYQFFSVLPPLGQILVSPSVGPLYLNSFTYPYFLIHGNRDPLLQTMHYKPFEDAVLHHQMRYGDATSSVLLKGCDRYLRDEQGQVPTDLFEALSHWVDEVLRTRKRPQEPAARGAA